MICLFIKYSLLAAV